MCNLSPIRFVALVLAAGAAFAQAPASTPPGTPDTVPTGSISGQVIFSVSKAPAADATVRVRSGGKNVETSTDTLGHYLLKDVPPGSATVVASPKQQPGIPITTSRRIQLGPGQDLTSIDLQLVTPPQIKGRVIDQNKEPIADMMVMLVAREYSHGALRYVFHSASITDDQGNYTMGRIETDRAFLLLARPRGVQVNPISDLPTDPSMRKRATAATFYPGTTEAEGAQSLTLRDGEMREGVDIPVIRAPSLCMEGRILAGGSPGIMSFGIAPERPTYGTSGNGGMYGQDPFFGKTGADGAIRACGLTPGTYTITVFQPPTGQDAPAFYGIANFTLTDTDIRDVQVSARPRIPVPVEVALDGPPPVSTNNDPAVLPKVNLNLQSVVRSQFGGEKRGGSITVPGSLLLDGQLMDNYAVSVNGLSGSMYLEDVTYGDASVMRGLARVGGVPENSVLRAIIGQDGGLIQVTATDKDGNPAADCSITIFPANAITEADIAVTYVGGTTDQTGAWKSPTLAPGNYYVLATPTAPDRSPEAITKLMFARSQGSPVVLSPKSTLAVTAVERAPR